MIHSSYTQEQGFCSSDTNVSGGEERCGSMVVALQRREEGVRAEGEPSASTGGWLDVAVLLLTERGEGFSCLEMEESNELLLR